MLVEVYYKDSQLDRLQNYNLRGVKHGEVDYVTDSNKKW